MKENKKFFDNNRLNKGYNKVVNFHQSDANLNRKKYRHVLPPIEIIEQYEELHPGTLLQLLDMAQGEQNHRHAMDLLEIEKHARAAKLGRMFALIFVAIISVVTLVFILIGSPLVASIFAISAFASITIISYISSFNTVKKEPPRPFKYNNNNKNKKPRPLA